MLLMPQVILVEYDPRVKAMLISKILQKYYKKCTYASNHDEFLQKKEFLFYYKAKYAYYARMK